MVSEWILEICWGVEWIQSVVGAKLHTAESRKYWCHYFHVKSDASSSKTPSRATTEIKLANKKDDSRSGTRREKRVDGEDRVADVGACSSCLQCAKSVWALLLTITASISNAQNVNIHSDVCKQHLFSDCVKSLINICLNQTLKQFCCLVHLEFSSCMLSSLFQQKLLSRLSAQHTRA
jgi:hypothetical protein